jgi:CheY-like chemotaxis protein
MSTGTVLIVDDSPDNLNLLAGILREHDYDVCMASNGRRALSTARLERPELIMLDIQMPEIDGYEVCRQLKADAATSDIPVIFISALDDVFDKVRAFKAGGVDYVTKPFHAEEVLARVESQLQIFRLRRELERRNEELTRKNQELVQSQQRVEIVFSALSDLLPGTDLDDRYRLEEKIGTGGFGAVYRAMHLDLDRPVAVKVFRPARGNDTRGSLERFRREGVSACRVNHPNAVAVLDSGISSTGIAYLVMELLQGRTLGDELREKRRLSLARCAEVVAPVCGALAAAHEANIVHRDIKPDNVFLHQAGGREIVKVVDFGIAKLLEDEPDPQGDQGTGNSELVGTPVYIAPERFGYGPYDGRADVYSLGVMVYQMLTGSFPFELAGGSVYALMTNLLTQRPRPLREIVPDLPESVEAAVMRTLAKDQNERPTASAFAVEFAAASGLDPQRPA